MTATVYRMRDAAGALLYVGVSGSTLARFHQHAQQKWWWVQVASLEVTHYENRTLADQAESAAIASEEPRYNVQGRGDWADPRERFVVGQTDGFSVWVNDAPDELLLPSLTLDVDLGDEHGDDL